MAKESLPKSFVKIKMCSAPDCDEFARCRGLCEFHRNRLRTGIPFDRPKFARPFSKPRQPKQPSQHKAFLSERNVRLQKLYESGYTLYECADMENMTAERVRQILRKAGVERISGVNRLIKKGKAIIKGYQKGHSYADLAKFFQITKTHIGRTILAWKHTLTNSEKKSKRAEREIAMFYLLKRQATPSGDCLEWTHQINPVSGYGRAKYKGRWIGAHVVSWQIHNGRDTTLHILHSCDNPPCVNPEHLREGTPADNMADRDARGRAGWQKDYDGWLFKLRVAKRQYRGGGGGRKFTDEQIEEIRVRYLIKAESARSIATNLGCHFSEITRIARYDTYKYRRDGTLFEIHQANSKVHSLFGRTKELI